MGGCKIIPDKGKIRKEETKRKVLDESHLVSVGHKRFLRCDNTPAGEMNIHFEFRPQE